MRLLTRIRRWIEASRDTVTYHGPKVRLAIIAALIDLPVDRGMRLTPLCHKIQTWLPSCRDTQVILALKELESIGCLEQA